MSSLDPIISADLVRTRAELAAVATALANARNEITGVANIMNVTRNELAAARNEIAGVGASSVIKSVQRGVAMILPTTNPGVSLFTVQVAAVTPAKCMLNITGMSGLRYDPYTYVPAHAQLTSATTIQLMLSVPAIQGYASNYYLGWELLEFK